MANTPISSFRLDPETKDRLRAVSENMGVSMTEAVKRAAEAFDELNRAANRAFPEKARRYQIERRMANEEAAAAALAEYLMDRDWPSATPRERAVRHSFKYSSMAAAILNGEAWAIREAWPEAAGDIATSSLNR